LDARGQLLQKADILRSQQKWPEAIAAYEAIIKKYPDDADAWYFYGYVLHASDNIDRAIEAHIKAASFGVRVQRPLYNLACAYALKGDKDKAIATLKQAIDAGFASKSYIAGDSDWDSLRNDPHFKAVVDSIN
jgi:Flp pilus assembly protein TadD